MQCKGWGSARRWCSGRQCRRVSTFQRRSRAVRRQWRGWPQPCRHESIRPLCFSRTTTKHGTMTCEGHWTLLQNSLKNLQRELFPRSRSRKHFYIVSRAVQVLLCHCCASLLWKIHCQVNQVCLWGSFSPVRQLALVWKTSQPPPPGPSKESPNQCSVVYLGGEGGPYQQQQRQQNSIRQFLFQARDPKKIATNNKLHLLNDSKIRM